MISHHIWSKCSSGLFPRCFEPITTFGYFGLFFPVRLWVSVFGTKFVGTRPLAMCQHTESVLNLIFVSTQLNGAFWVWGFFSASFLWWIILLKNSLHYAKLSYHSCFNEKLSGQWHKSKQGAGLWKLTLPPTQQPQKYQSCNFYKYISSGTCSGWASEWKTLRYEIELSLVTGVSCSLHSRVLAWGRQRCDGVELKAVVRDRNLRAFSVLLNGAVAAPGSSSQPSSFTYGECFKAKNLRGYLGRI